MPDPMAVDKSRALNDSINQLDSSPNAFGSITSTPSLKVGVIVKFSEEFIYWIEFLIT